MAIITTPNSALVASGDAVIIDDGREAASVITPRPDGSFIVTWSVPGDRPQAIKAQIFAADLVPVTEVFSVTTTATRDAEQPQILVADDNSFTVFWSEWKDGGDYFGGQMAQAFTAQGVANGEPFEVIEAPEGDHLRDTQLVELPEGGFALVWAESESTYSNNVPHLRGQIFEASGTAQGSVFDIGTMAPGSGAPFSATAQNDGSIAVSWQAGPVGGSNTDVVARLFTAEGEAMDGPATLSLGADAVDTDPGILALPDGSYFVSWISTGTDSAENGGVYGRHLDATGQADGEIIRIDQDTGFHNSLPALSLMPEGGILITWRSHPGSNYDGGQFGRILNDDGSLDGRQFHMLEPEYGHGRLADQTQTVLQNGQIVSLIWEDFSYMVPRSYIELDHLKLQLFDPSEAFFGTSQDDEITGTEAQDWIQGGRGDDAVQAGAGDDRVWGEEGNDTLNGGTGDDTLVGSYDTIAGSFGNDVLIGGPGSDTAIFDYSSATASVSLTGDIFTISLSYKQNQVSGVEIFQFTNQTLTLAEMTALASGAGGLTLTGTSGADTLNGDLGPDSINGLEGDDGLNGANGNDILSGGLGDDTLAGGNGDDLLQGGEGDDRLFGGADNDTIQGGAGDDLIRGGVGENLIDGGLGDDDIEGAEGNDIIGGGGGDDQIQGLGGDDFLFGGDGHDTLIGSDGDDTIRGGDGDDVLSGGYSFTIDYNKLHGGAGHDTIHGGGGRDEVTGGEGDDEINLGGGNDLAFGQDGNDTLNGGWGSDDLHGQNGDDVISGSVLSDLLTGGAGADFLNGGFGHDRINGGTGADSFYHLGIADHGSDWLQDYNAAEGDVLLFGNTTAVADDFQVNFTETDSAGVAGVAEAFVIYKPTEQIIWALIDGSSQDEIYLKIGTETFDLLA